MTSECEKTILKMANQILNVLIIKLKNEFELHYKDFFPIWYIAMADPNKKISKEAKIAYKSLVKKNIGLKDFLLPWMNIFKQ